MMNTERNLQIDNIKGLLILLVVVGHMLSMDFRDSNIVSSVLYAVIYSFHMPCFIFISGHLLNGKYLENHQMSNHMILIYYILGCILIMVTSSILTHRFVIVNPCRPPVAMWYLLSLFWMRLIAPWIIKVRWAIPICIIASLVAGTIDCVADEFSISRTICLLPYYIIGLTVNKDMLTKMRILRKGYKVLIALFAVVLESIFLIMFIKGGVNYSVLRLKCSYSESGVSDCYGMLMRMVMVLVAITVCCTLFVFVTEKECFLTKWGRNSLSVYLLHIVLFLVIRKFMCFSESFYGNSLSTLMAVAMAVGIVLVLSTDTVSRGLNSITNIIGKITFKQ